MKTTSFLNALDDAKIVSAIAEAESRTSGEIRVYVSDKEISDAVKEAEKQFSRLGMHRTERQNGVLIFFAPKSQNFAVIGDAGIHRQCGEAFWQEVAVAMEESLKEQHFTDAILKAVGRVGHALAAHFPREKADRNELPDRIAGDHTD
jgi:uncharacterized membrane protein